MQAPAMPETGPDKPDQHLSVREVFGIDSDLQVAAFSARSELVPDIDSGYHFNPEATLAILAGFTHNRRVLLQGLHGTGKSTHIEQVAARLNWPCIRVNLDGHISRLDLVGKDSIVIRDDRQVTEFQEGIVPWSLQRPIALIFDEYDACRPDVLFVIQRLLERDGKFTLIDQTRGLTPHPSFRLFATANTVGRTAQRGKTVMQRVRHAVRCAGIDTLTGQKQGAAPMAQFAQPGECAHRRAAELCRLLLLFLVW